MYLSCWLLGFERGRLIFINFVLGGDGVVKSYFVFRFIGEKWYFW